MESKKIIEQALEFGNDKFYDMKDESSRDTIGGIEDFEFIIDNKIYNINIDGFR